MTKILPLAATLTMLMTISGQAFAATVASDTSSSDQQAIYISNAAGPTVSTETGVTYAYRYHGGPKAND